MRITYTFLFGFMNTTTNAYYKYMSEAFVPILFTGLSLSPLSLFVFLIIWLTSWRVHIIETLQKTLHYHNIVVVGCPWHLATRPLLLRTVFSFLFFCLAETSLSLTQNPRRGTPGYGPYVISCSTILFMYFFPLSLRVHWTWRFVRNTIAEDSTHQLTYVWYYPGYDRKSG